MNRPGDLYLYRNNGIPTSLQLIISVTAVHVVYYEVDDKNLIDSMPSKIICLTASLFNWVKQRGSMQLLERL